MRTVYEVIKRPIISATESKGSRIGCFGASGLLVLNALLFGFANTNSGRCDPSYSTLQVATGLCRSTIAITINRLATSGIITVTRRNFPIVSTIASKSLRAVVSKRQPFVNLVAQTSGIYVNELKVE